MNDIKDRISLIRKKNLMSSTQFAKALGLSQPAIYKWETGESIPKGQHLIKIYQVFKASPTWILLGMSDLALNDGNSTTDTKKN